MLESLFGIHWKRIPAGSFWTQPVGEAHITAAQGANNVAYIEIDSGPYLVHPESEAFDNGERPINVDSSNLVWLNAADIAWLPAADSTAEVAFLWGNRKAEQLSGSMLKLPADFSGSIQSKASKFHAVVIQGKLDIAEAEKALSAGSYFHLENGQSAAISASNESETIIYIRADGKYELISSSSNN